MRLAQLTWPEVEAYLQQRQELIVPIGATEQHGPMGLIGTDAICPEVIADQISARTGIVVGPTIAFGMSQHHLAFPGTLSLKPTTLMALLKDIIDSCRHHGLTRIYFINGHGGNVATINSAFADIYAAASLTDSPSTLYLRLWNWYEGSGVRAISKREFGLEEGMHATPSEISLTYLAYPETVKSIPLAPIQATVGHFRDSHDFRRQYPDGRIGANSALASIEHGRALLAAAVEDFLRLLDQNR
ncbi:creatininase family protein [Ectothiorhodospiraceae bacterium BW-2]|nr:creatininase family protein [Ectothiorhodospiraceae bacterium BW-2]